MLEWRQAESQTTDRPYQATCLHTCTHTNTHTHTVTIRARHVDSLLLCPVWVVAFVLASRSASQDLSGGEKAGTERKKMREGQKSKIIMLLVIILTRGHWRREECGVVADGTVEAEWRWWQSVMAVKTWQAICTKTMPPATYNLHWFYHSWKCSISAEKLKTSESEIRFANTPALCFDNGTSLSKSTRLSKSKSSTI